MPPVSARRKPSTPSRGPRPKPNRGPTSGSGPASGAAATGKAAGGGGAAKPDAEILFQDYFKSVGPRTYAAQVKRAGNGNHFLVLTEGKRDDTTGEVRKTRLFVFSEDFVTFFRMLSKTAQFIRENPVPEEVKQKRQKFWDKQKREPVPGGKPGRQ